MNILLTTILVLLSSFLCSESSNSEIETPSEAQTLFSPESLKPNANYLKPSPPSTSKNTVELKFYAQSQIGASRFRTDSLVFGGHHRYTFEDSSLLRPDSNKTPDSEYGFGYYIQNNIGLTAFENYSIALGFFQGHSKLTLKNKRAVKDDRQILINAEEKSETQAYLTTFYWNPVSFPIKKWLSCIPYIGLGFGIARIDRKFSGYLDESKKRDGGLFPIMMPTFGWGQAPRTLARDPITRHPIDNVSREYKVPFVFDLGFNLGGGFNLKPGFDLSLGYRLYQVTSARIEPSFYSGLQVTY